MGFVGNVPVLSIDPLGLFLGFEKEKWEKNRVVSKKEIDVSLCILDYLFPEQHLLTAKTPFSGRTKNRIIRRMQGDRDKSDEKRKVFHGTNPKTQHYGQYIRHKDTIMMNTRGKKVGDYGGLSWENFTATLVHEYVHKEDFGVLSSDLTGHIADLVGAGNKINRAWKAEDKITDAVNRAKSQKMGELVCCASTSKQEYRSDFTRWHFILFTCKAKSRDQLCGLRQEFLRVDFN